MVVEDRDAEVRQRAYELWEKAGRPWGREHEFWAIASLEIEGEKQEQEAVERSVAR
ncbi:DUF2934 domain-containing protein [Aureimonas sp. AU4]|uniref:DUF2934 domain-containing protein n=1 Tax=Aureimonas sp. AU4 TaxID=1638163 RepID=UPI0009E9987E|nr:DUF2934 domain-containing protein [Aureimonas sp. AU4]